MNVRKLNIVLFASLLASLCAAPAQSPVITSFSQNGQLVCANLQTGTVAAVEWASSMSGPWTNNWAGLAAVAVESNNSITVSVPMFYRVRGIPQTPTYMVLIPAGAFTMGDISDGDSSGLPLHTNYISAFYMDKYEVTKAMWDKVYQWSITNGYGFNNAGLGKATNHPVQMINWHDAVKWCNARSEMAGHVPAYYTDAAMKTVYRTGQIDLQNDWVKWGQGYRLPTEAEWEKAARGEASEQRFPFGNTIEHSQANYKSDPLYAYDISPTRGYHPTFATGATPYTSPAGNFAANGFGLFDMAGNVWELCWDRHGSYGSASQTDPRGPTSGYNRVFRGGGWYDYAIYCRSAFRNSSVDPTGSSFNVGFRSVLSPGQ